MDDQYQHPPQGGEYIPPQQPTYQVTSDIPPTSPYHRSPQPRSSSGTTAGWLAGLGTAAIAFVKYGGLLLLKIPALGSLVSVLISFGAYSWAAGPSFAVALIGMLFIHEMGHVLEIRRQGMQATAPIFIPFLGAAIFQRSHPTTALKQAQIGIAGPIAGTIGATASYLLFLSTGWEGFIIAAVLGFALNLFNLIPVWQLDGYALVVATVLWIHSIFLIIIAVFGISSLINRFRTADSPYYTSVPAQARWALAGAWLALVLYLGFMTEQALTFFNPFVR